MRSFKGLFVRDVRNCKTILIIFTVFMSLIMLMNLQRVTNERENSDLGNQVVVENNTVGITSYGNGELGTGLTILGTTDEYAMVIALIFCAMAGMVTTYLFYVDKEMKSGEFIASLPIKKSKVFACKILAGMLAVVALAVVYVVELLAIRAMNIEWLNENYKIYENYALIMKSQSVLSVIMSVIPYVILAFIVIAIVALFQTLITRAVFASIMACMFSAAPFIIVEGIGSLFDKYFSATLDTFLNMPSKMSIEDYGFKCVENYLGSTVDIEVFPEHFFRNAGIMLLSVVVIIGVAVLINKKYELSMKSKIIWSRPVKYVLEVVTGAAISMQILSVNNIDTMAKPAVIAIMILITALIAIVFNKLLEKNAS